MPGSRLRFAASLPERAVRATVASLGGVVHESAQVLLPRVVPPEADFESVDDLLGAFEGASGRTAGLLDVPPLELAELRATLAELRRDAETLPTQDELAALFRGLKRTAAAERRPLLEVSTGMGMAILLSARSVGRTHLVVPYREDWRPLRSEGFAAYARRVSRPYGRAVAGHFDPARLTWTERLLARLRRRT